MHPTPETIRNSRWLTFEDATSNREYFWNATFHYSIWKNQLFPSSQRDARYTNAQIWEAFVALQSDNLFLQCSVCFSDVSYEKSRMCLLCGKIVHGICLGKNNEACRFCSPKNSRFPNPSDNCKPEVESTTMFSRVKKLVLGFSNHSKAVLKSLEYEDNGATILKEMVTQHFQRGFRDYIIKPIPTKGHTLGVLATQNIAPFTRVGIYPGYPDPLCATQCHYGRRIPIFHLEGSNCADSSNRIFEEFQHTCAPYINEPNSSENANCGWINERMDLKTITSYSMMTVREIRAGEELLIGYGPSYLRDYEFNYDHFVFLPSKNDIEGETYDMFHWSSDDSENARLISRVMYISSQDKYDLHSVS